MFKDDILSHTTEIISILISLALWTSTWVLSQGYMAKPPPPHMRPYYLMLIPLPCLPLLFLTFFHPPTNTLIFVRRHLC